MITPVLLARRWTVTGSADGRGGGPAGRAPRIWAYHDGVDLGGPAMSRIARDYGYTLDELRKL